jgi:hypothetical protein
VHALHVTNGTGAVTRLRAAGFGEPAVTWDDVLHDGPIPAGTDDALREVRARFIAERGWATLAAARTHLACRDRALADALGDRESDVVLWFEHDLYDQLQLAQVLDVVARHPARAARVSAVHADDYLGHAEPDRLRAWRAAAQEISEAELEAASVAWEACRAPDPRRLAALVASTRTAALPHMRGALARLLEEFPGARDGLARSERQALAAIAAGARSGADAFAECARREAAAYLGDASFAWYLDRLARCREPLLRLHAGAGSDNGDGPVLALWALELTPAGERVLAGEADHMVMNAPTRWVGGTLVDGLSPWRWDGARIVRTTAAG